MSITFHCPCGKTLQIGEDHAGQKGRCPACGQVLDVPVYALAFAEEGSAAPLPALPVAAPDAAAGVALSPHMDPVQSGLWNQITGEPVAPSAPSSTVGRPYYKLYSPHAVAGASLLGGALAGAIVLTYNYQLLGRKRPAMLALGGGVGGAAASLLLLGLLPAWLGLPLILLGSALALFGIAHFVQGPAFRAHREKGGEEASAVGAAGLGLLCSALFVLVWFVGYFPFSSQEQYQSVSFGAHGVYYTPGVTAAEAEKLGKLLVEWGLFDNGERYHGSKYVWLSRRGRDYIVSFLLRDGAWDKTEIVAATREMRRMIAAQLFPENAVEIWLCDGQRNLKRIVKD